MFYIYQNIQWQHHIGCKKSASDEPFFFIYISHLFHLFQLLLKLLCFIFVFVHIFIFVSSFASILWVQINVLWFEPTILKWYHKTFFVQFCDIKNLDKFSSKKFSKISRISSRKLKKLNFSIILGKKWSKYPKKQLIPIKEKAKAFRNHQKIGILNSAHHMTHHSSCQNLRLIKHFFVQKTKGPRFNKFTWTYGFTYQWSQDG